MRPPLPFALLALLAPPPLAQAKPPTLDRFFPPGAQRGKTIEVAAEGSFDSWPVQAWIQGRGVEVRAAEAKGKLAVVVAPDAPAGVTWIRLYNEEGASELRPFLVCTLPEIVEAEPNDAPSAAQAIGNSPIIINGRLAKNGDVDGFTVPLHARQTLVAAMQAHETLAVPMDAVLQVARPDGIVLEQADDSGGLDPRLVFVAPERGDYLVRTFAFPSEPSSSIRFAGGEAYVYRLTLTTGPFADYAFPLAVPRTNPGWVGVFGWNLPDETRLLPVLPLDPNSDQAQASHPALAAPAEVRLVPHPVAFERTDTGISGPQVIAAPVSISGRIGAEGERDVYRFAAEKGQVRLLRVASRSLGFPLDPVLRVLDRAGKVLAESDDAEKSGRDPEIRFDPPAAGEYRAEVRDLNGRGGPRFVYRLELAPPVPEVGLTLKDGRFTLAPNKTLEIAVAVDRRQGFDDDLSLTIEGLPAGVTVTPASSGSKGETAKAVTLALTSHGTPAWSGPIRIVGESPGLEGKRFAEAAIEATGTTTKHPWLTVLKPEETRGMQTLETPRDRH